MEERVIVPTSEIAILGKPTALHVHPLDGQAKRPVFLVRC
jgi:hypothetical protein